MSNIRQVQWNNEAPEKIRPGMLLDTVNDGVVLVGDLLDDGCICSDNWEPIEAEEIKRWAWLIQPHELKWLEDMASRKTRTQE